MVFIGRSFLETEIQGNLVKEGQQKHQVFSQGGQCPGKNESIIQGEN